MDLNTYAVFLGITVDMGYWVCRYLALGPFDR